MGIKRIEHDEALWRKLGELGDQQSYFLLEQFVAGAVYHVDAIVWQSKVVFATAHQYLQPPIDVAHEGGVFVTRTMPRQAKETKSLLKLHNKLILALGMARGVAHTEFIKGADGDFYFLETAARVGGANIEQLVEASSGDQFVGGMGAVGNGRAAGRSVSDSARHQQLRWRDDLPSTTGDGLIYPATKTQKLSIVSTKSSTLASLWLRQNLSALNNSSKTTDLALPKTFWPLPRRWIQLQLRDISVIL